MFRGTFNRSLKGLDRMRTDRIFRSLPTLVLALLAGADSLHAQAGGGFPPDGTNLVRHVSARAALRYDWPTGLAGDGEVSVRRYSLGGGVTEPVSDRLAVGLEADAEFSAYRFAGTVPLVGVMDDMASDTLSIRAGPSLRYRRNEDWSYLASLRFSFTGETDADPVRAMQGTLMLGAGYAVSPAFRLNTALAVISRIQDTPLVIPFILADWTITDRIRLATQGPGLGLTARLYRSGAVTLRGRWEYRQYRLDDDAALPDGVFRDSRINLSLEYTQYITRQAGLSLEVGRALYQKMSLLDRDGDHHGDLEADPVVFSSLSLVARF
jgi:hypothetical protein